MAKQTRETRERNATGGRTVRFAINRLAFQSKLPAPIEIHHFV
jgi:hypothetical protein